MCEILPNLPNHMLHIQENLLDEVTDYEKVT